MSFSAHGRAPPARRRGHPGPQGNRASLSMIGSSLRRERSRGHDEAARAHDDRIRAEAARQRCRNTSARECTGGGPPSAATLGARASPACRGTSPRGPHEIAEPDGPRSGHDDPLDVQGDSARISCGRRERASEEQKPRAACAPASSRPPTSSATSRWRAWSRRSGWRGSSARTPSGPRSCSPSP